MKLSPVLRNTPLGVRILVRGVIVDSANDALEACQRVHEILRSEPATGSWVGARIYAVDPYDLEDTTRGELLGQWLLIKNGDIVALDNRARELERYIRTTPGGTLP